jgi:hypothetical protein
MGISRNVVRIVVKNEVQFERKIERLSGNGERDVNVRSRRSRLWLTKAFSQKRWESSRNICKRFFQEVKISKAIEIIQDRGSVVRIHPYRTAP